MDLKDEQDFTRKAISAFEPDLSCEPYAKGRGRDEWTRGISADMAGHGAGLVFDAEGDAIAITETFNQAEVIARLLNWAVENYQFRHPDDPEIVNRGLFGKREEGIEPLDREGGPQ